MTMILHCFGESGNAYKAALPLHLSGLDWRPEFVDFFNGGTRSGEFRQLNPMGEVPVLVDGDLVLSQSGAIQHYIAEQSGRLRRQFRRCAAGDPALDSLGQSQEFIHCRNAAVPDEFHSARQAPRTRHWMASGAGEVSLAHS